MLREIPELQRRGENSYKLPKRRNKWPKKEIGSDEPQAVTKKGGGKENSGAGAGNYTSHWNGWETA